MSEPNKKKILKIGTSGYKIVEVKKVGGEKPRSKFPILDVSEIGFSIALPITLGALFGLWLDSKVGTRPLFTLLLLGVGIFFAFYNLYLIVKQFSK